MLLGAHMRRRAEALQASQAARREPKLATALASGAQGRSELRWAPTAHRRRAKNCKNLKRQGTRAASASTKHKLATTSLTSDLDLLREQIGYLDSQHTLLMSITLGARQNAEAAAAKILSNYHAMFRHGYWPHGSSRQVQSAAMAKAYVLSVFDDDFRSPDFAGALGLLQQGELYSSFHTSVDMVVDRVEVMPMYTSNDSDVYVVKSVGTTSYGISAKTIEHIFPSIQSDAALVQRLIGQVYRLPYTIVVHINSNGRIFQMESYVDTTSGLLDLIQSPLTAVRMLQSSVISQGGNLQLEPGVQDGQNELEHALL